MNAEILVGEQLEGQTLYERQKRLRDNNCFIPGPIIIAAGLHVPENVGSVFRLADAAGSEKVIIIDDDHHSYPMARIRKTARSCEALVEWESWTQQQFVTACDEMQPFIALELTSHSTSIFVTDLPSRCALLIGNERRGIPQFLLSKCQSAVHIPMFGVNGSMNVTHALAVALFEWRRQHNEERKQIDRNSTF